MNKITGISKKLFQLIRESYEIALPLFRIMIPMIVLIKILKEFGTIEILALMGLFHSVIEDTLLILLLGGSIWGFLVGRMFFSFLLIWFMVKCVSFISEQSFRRYFFKTT